MKRLAFPMLAAALLAITPACSGGDNKSKSPSDQTQVKLSVRDQQREMSFQQYPDGKIELTVTEEKDGKKNTSTYKATNLEEFKKQYPEIAQRYQIDRLTAPKFWQPVETAPLASGWDAWKKAFEQNWFWDDPQQAKEFEKMQQAFRSDDLDRWFNEQRKLFSQFRSMNAPPSEQAAGKPAAQHPLGVAVVPVDGALRAQLNLDPKEGVLVLDVSNGSRAEKAGIMKNDVIIKLNDKTVDGVDDFRKDVRASSDKQFTLELVRKGKTQSIDVPMRHEQASAG